MENTNKPIKSIAKKSIKTDRFTEDNKHVYEDKATAFVKTVYKDDGDSYDVLEISIDKNYLKEIITKQKEYEEKNGKSYSNYNISLNWGKKYKLIENQIEDKTTKKAEVIDADSEKTISADDLPF